MVIFIVAIAGTAIWVKGVLYIRGSIVQGQVGDTRNSDNTRDSSRNNTTDNRLVFNVGPAERSYGMVAESTLFRPLGWQKTVVQEEVAAVAPRMAQEAPLVRKPSYPALTLTGIVQNGAERLAIIEDGAINKGYFLSQGEKIKDFEISEILSDHVLLANGSQSTSFSLGDSIHYDPGGRILLDVIADQTEYRGSIQKSPQQQGSTESEGEQMSLIERLRARRRKELGEE
jgi:hypothetical protein